MLDWLEGHLARLTGRDQWPSVKGKIESILAIPDGQIRNPRASRYAFITYEVGNQEYTAAIRQIAGQRSRPAHKGGSVTIQYSPSKPSDYYFAPACKLAGRAVAVLIVLLGVIAIAVAVHSVITAPLFP